MLLNCMNLQLTNEADDVRVFSLYSKANHETEPRVPLAELGNLTLESAFPQRIETANRHSDNTAENKTSARKWPHLPVNFVVAYDPDSTLATISLQPQLEMNSIFHFQNSRQKPQYYDLRIKHRFASITRVCIINSETAEARENSPISPMGC